jgi:hypothetical protein
MNFVIILLFCRHRSEEFYLENISNVTFPSVKVVKASLPTQLRAKSALALNHLAPDAAAPLSFISQTQINGNDCKGN